ncbi:MAG: DNA mismatch endonuclease Vsr [Enhygromyxa sp.]
MAGNKKTRWVVREGHSIEVDEETSARMAGVRQKDTKPEQIVRRIVTRLGHRYRLQNKELPGRPDLANRSKKWVIFVHGCFWHRHPGCRLATTPKRNAEFWQAKFDRNVARDQRAVEDLEALGYTVMTIWECETRNLDRVVHSLRTQLDEIASRHDRRTRER